MESIFFGLLIGLGIYLAPVILAFFIGIIAFVIAVLSIFFEHLGKFFGSKKK